MTAALVLAALRERHAGSGWAFYEELRAGTGFEPWRVSVMRKNGVALEPGQVRAQRIDAFAINCWPSRGRVAIAYEVKVSRSDFRCELANPAKRAFAEAVSSECYFACPLKLIRPDEVPEPWGLVAVIANGKTKILKQAVSRELAPWPHWFITSIARRASRAGAGQ